MKRNLIFSVMVAIGLLALPTISNAQLQWGIKGGYNLTNLVTPADNAPAFAARHGLHAGVFTELKVAIIALQIEALFSQQGAKLDGSDFVYKHDYLLIPAVAKVELGPLDVHAGLQYDMLLSAKFDGQDTKDSFKNGISVPVGAGIDVKKFQLEARYIFGLTDIVDDPDATDKLTNAVLQVSLGLKF